MSHDYLDFYNSEKNIELFWSTFKDNVVRFLDDEERKKIFELSSCFENNKINICFEKMELFIIQNIENIGYKIIIKNDFYRANHLDSNLKRWKKISTYDICKEDNVFFCVLKIFLLIHKKENLDSITKNKILDLLKNFSLNHDLSFLYEVMNLSIKHNILGIIDKLRNIIDINNFIQLDIHPSNSLNFKKMKTRKLISFLRELKL